MRPAIAATTAAALLLLGGLDSLAALLLPRWLAHGLAGMAGVVVLVLAGLAVQASGKRRT